MQTMTLADGLEDYDNAIELSDDFLEDDDEQLSGKFGNFLRKGARFAANFAPPGISTGLKMYSNLPEFNPGGGQPRQKFNFGTFINAATGKPMMGSPIGGGRGLPGGVTPDMIIGGAKKLGGLFKRRKKRGGGGGGDEMQMPQMQMPQMQMPQGPTGGYGGPVDQGAGMEMYGGGLPGMKTEKGLFSKKNLMIAGGVIVVGGIIYAVVKAKK
jgi:hypothetical protein